MGNSNLRHVSPGDPLTIPASAYNSFVDAARAHQLNQLGGGANRLPDVLPAGIVHLRNDTGAVRRRFDVLAIAGPIIGPLDNEYEFASRITVVGVTPTDELIGKPAVLQEPLHPGAIGRAAIDGLTIARVKMTSPSDTHADLEAGTVDYLVSGSNGTVQLLWVQPQSDWQDDVAVVIARIGGAGGAGLERAKITGYTANKAAYLGRRLNPDDSYMDDQDLVIHAKLPDGTNLSRTLNKFVSDGADNEILQEIVHVSKGNNGLWYIVDMVIPVCVEEGVLDTTPKPKDPTGTPPGGGGGLPPGGIGGAGGSGLRAKLRDVTYTTREGLPDQPELPGGREQAKDDLINGTGGCAC